MKTPEQWIAEKSTYGSLFKSARWIAAIQSDAREGMVPFDMPKLMPTTAKLVLDFAKALADKLADAEVKYGYGDSWATPDAEDWPDPKCYTDLVKHLQKGDPRDVAIYCAFLWYHKLSTSKCLEMAGMVPADRLQAVERDNGLLKEQIRVADVAYQSLHERHQAVEAQRDRLRIYVIEFLNDWKKGDFQLSELAACDALAMEEALQPAQKEPQ